MGLGFYHGSTTISPHRQSSKSHGDLTATRLKTKELAQEVQDAVEEDLTIHYRVTDTMDFLNRLLPVEKTKLDAILEHMKVEELYDSKSRRWKGFLDPTRQESGSKEKKKRKGKKGQKGPKEEKKPKENALYGAFCRIAEAIRVFIEEKGLGSTLEMGASKWVDYHSQSPKTPDSNAAQLRPDVLFALRAVAEQTVLKDFQQEQREEMADEGVEAEDEAGKDEDEPEEEEEAKDELEEGQDKGQKKRTKKNILQYIWWLQIIAAVEMKQTDSRDWLAVVKQLFGYLRRILREQLDRRFVFGLTLGPEMMTVWLHDRSGVIGTKTAINIHKEPLKFIQVIAAFSLLPPEMLGFDPTIKMLVSPSQAVSSYKPNEEFIRAYQEAPHNRRWVITMNSGLKYVTVETVSSVRAGFMRGRGSIAWVVVPFEGAKDESKVLVLKQSWRPCEVDSEGDLDNKSDCDYVGKIDLCEDVLISRRRDATDTLIRQSLDDSTGLGKRSRDQSHQTTTADRDRDIHVTFTDVGDIKEVIARETGPPVARVRTRVVLSTYGWLIKYFSTRRELLVVLRDAIRGHKYLYERGVLHRDISPGNILIKWQPGSEPDQPSTSGCLIDLDHAKRGKPSSEMSAQSVDDVLAVDEVALLWCSMKNVETEVACRASAFFPVKDDDDDNTIPTITYLNAALAHSSRFRHLSGQLCTPQHLQWKSVQIPYDFKFTERQKGSRTGTPPYTSGEILSGQRYFHGHQDKVFHDAVHDLESFFWVLVHICITRQGPGGVRREELEQKNQANEEYNGLRRVVHFFFDSDIDTMAANKIEIFTHPNHFEKYVLDNFHTYFQPLRDLVKEWFHLLILAHQFHAFEYYDIHDMVLEILDRSLESAPPDDIDEVARKVLDDRKANIEKLLDGSPFGKVQQSPPPHTSPTGQRRVTQHFYCSDPSSPSRAPRKKGKVK